MTTYLTTITDTFDIKGRGLIIAPFFPEKRYQFSRNEKVKVIRPDKTDIECEAFFQIPYMSPQPKEFEYHCALLSVEKNDVPIGSEVWILDKSKEELLK